MKTSNKILIVLAALLFLIPMAVFTADVALNYQDKASEKVIEQSRKHFNKPTPGFVSIPTKTIRSVVIPRTEGVRLTIFFVNDQHSGLKISEILKDRLLPAVDNNGVLTIRRKPDDGKDYDIYTLWIYSSQPVDHVRAEGLNSLNIGGAADSLSLYLQNVADFRFEAGKPINYVNLQADKCTVLLGGMPVQHIDAFIKNSTLTVSGTAPEHLSLSGRGNPRVDIQGTNDPMQATFMKSLSLDLPDAGNLLIQNVRIGKVSGRLGDSVTVYMPAIYARQLLR